MNLIKMENTLTKDLIDKIYSMIIYEQPTDLLIQIKTYKYKKQYITLCYEYIVQHWNFFFYRCFRNILEIILYFND